jgi:hypothetical protein
MAIDKVELAMQLLADHNQAFGQQRANMFGVPLRTTFKTVPSATPTTAYGHGNGGLFSYPGLERPIFSAMVLPMTGLQSMLPVRPNNTENPVYGIFTGVLGTSGGEPSGPCDDPPTAGMSKLCEHTFVWGRQSRQSRVFELDKFGRITNRGEFLDLQLLGNALNVPPNNPNVPTLPGVATPANALQNEAAKALFEMAVAWARDFAQELYSGNPTNNTTNQGRKYFYGLDILINSNYRDAETNTPCPAADSLIQSFGNLRVDSNATAAVRTITYLMRNLKYIAQRTGLDPAEWVLAMRWGLFYELTEIWPIAYHTYRNTVQAGTANTNQLLTNNGMDLSAMRDKMRQGQYLLIDGVEVPVVCDEAIAETEAAKGVFSSTIYFVPLTVLGGTPVTFIEYFNYDAPGAAMEAARIFAPDGSYYTSDTGRFLWHRKPPTNYCVQVMAKTEPRVLLLTPYIAARLTNVYYSPLIHERDAFTSAGYYVDGGKTSRLGYGPSLFYPAG